MRAIHYPYSVPAVISMFHTGGVDYRYKISLYVLEIWRIFWNSSRKQTENGSLWLKTFNFLKIVENVTFPENVQNAKRANVTKNIHKKSALISYRVL